MCELLRLHACGSVVMCRGQDPQAQGTAFEHGGGPRRMLARAWWLVDNGRELQDTHMRMRMRDDLTALVLPPQAGHVEAFAPSAAGVLSARTPAAAISSRQSISTQTAFAGYGSLAPKFSVLPPQPRIASLTFPTDPLSPVCRRVAPLRATSRGLASLNMMERERTFIMVKPDAVQRGLVGNIITSVPPSPLRAPPHPVLLPSLSIAVQM